MTTFLSDTHPEAEQVLIQLLRQASPGRKLEMMGQLNAMAKTLAFNNLRQQYPDAEEKELQRRLADRILGPELAARAYGPPTVIIREDANAV